MTDDTKLMETLGREVGAALGTGPGEQQRLAQKRALMAAVGAVRPAHGTGRRRMLVPVLAAAALVVIALAAVLVLLLTGEKPAQFWIDDTLIVDNKGLGLQARADKPLYLRFDDGSRMELDRSSSGQIVDATTKNVNIILKNGKMTAGINRSSGRTWTIEAGPYRIRVTGTTFSVSWNEEKTLLNVLVRQGSVVVTGSALSQAGVTLIAGDHLHIDDKRGLISIKPAKKETGTAAGAAVPAGMQAGQEQQQEKPSAQEEQAPAFAEEPAAAVKKAQKAPPSWKALAEEGKYAAAMEAADKQGFDKLLSLLSLSELWQLADAARYARDGKKAKKALLAVRDRFAGTKRSKMAAFLLGRVALELNKSPQESITWFKTYLKEDPDGPLSEEALGKLISAYMKAGQNGNAEKTAEIYLKQHEHGSFSELAKKILKSRVTP